MSRGIGAPVIDGVVADVKLIESLVTPGLTTSRHDEFAAPTAKPCTGLLAPFARTPLGGAEALLPR